MARVTINDCLDKVNNHFELVLVATIRAREILSGRNPTIAREGSTVSVIALREIAEGTIDIKKIRHNLPIIFSNGDNVTTALYPNVDTSLVEEGIVTETEASNLLVIEEAEGDKLLSSD